MDEKSAGDGLPLGYRIAYRIRHLMLSVFGPAQLGEDDPMRQLEHEHDLKVEAVRSEHDRERS